ncbi:MULTISPECIES: hypothetical protein [unclassified Streptomyces]|uniref:hypothetical protein n=1 Tax=unclassified Streptomyces TaxID=2593676 RepID=UPI0011610476|nr:hypothetical protein [Streptomyces sp. TSRI0281]
MRPKPPRTAGVSTVPKNPRKRVAQLPEPVRPFRSAGEIKAGQIVFDKDKNMPCTVISVRCGMVRVTRPAGVPWETHYKRLLPGTAYHCRQLDALAALAVSRVRGRQERDASALRGPS